MEVSVGDEVLLRRYPKGRKFDPLYEDDIYEVVAVEDKGVTVKGEGGKLKRRHKDDVKHFCGVTQYDDEPSGEEATATVAAEEQMRPAETSTTSRDPLLDSPGPSGARGTVEVPRDGSNVESSDTEFAPVEERPKRNRRQPAYLKDYVLRRLEWA